ncbi:MAG: hypothetical protein K6T83_22490 [Alicyclobacillus sp.]|nr:hypothetical protein [Alicyclobacillus sp.]
MPVQNNLSVAIWSVPVLGLSFLLVVMVLLACLCTWLRARAVRWLFTCLSVVFWIACLSLLGFVLGYRVGEHGVHLTRWLSSSARL